MSRRLAPLLDVAELEWVPGVAGEVGEAVRAG